MVIQLYYVEELNVKEIAEVLDVSSGRVSQIKKSAIANLRDGMKNLRDLANEQTQFFESITEIEMRVHRAEQQIQLAKRLNV